MRRLRSGLLTIVCLAGVKATVAQDVVGVPPGTYFGCYARLGTKDVKPSVDAAMSNALCEWTCLRGAHRYAATSGEGCYCDDVLPPPASLAPVACVEPCPGDAAEACGSARGPSAARKYSVFLLPACRRDGASIPPLLVVRLFFGANINAPPGAAVAAGEVTDQQFQDVALKPIIERFPGANVVSGVGVFKSERQDPPVVREKAWTVTLMLTPQQAAETQVDAAVAEVIAAYNRTFNQVSVLKTEAFECGGFVEVRGTSR
jgi:hypothetical protein